MGIMVNLPYGIEEIACSADELLGYIQEYYEKGIYFGTNVVGTKYYPKGQKVLERLSSLVDRSGFKVVAEREKDNLYDSNAISVNIQKKTNKVKIGYINRRLASVLSYLVEQGVKLEEQDYRIYGGSGRSAYGLTLYYRLIPGGEWDDDGNR